MSFHLVYELLTCIFEKEYNGMKTYGDLEIIENQRKWENEQKSDIYSAVYIKGDMYTYEYVKLFQEHMQMMLPVQFKDMPQKMIEIKYPMRDRPSIIKTNLEGDVNYTYKLLPLPCKPEKIEENAKVLKQMLQRVMPQYKMNKEYGGKTQNTMYYGFDYTFNTIDTKAYNLLYGFSIHNTYVQGTFTCLESDAELWIPSVIQSIESIEDLTKNDEL